MTGDDSLGSIDQQVPKVLADPECQKYIAGLAFHWYGSHDNSSLFDSLPRIYKVVKDKIEFVLMTEACNGYQVSDVMVDLGSWERGKAYASDIIEDLVRWSGGWIDWNLALNLEGGLNWARSFADSPVIVDVDMNEFYLQPMYYALAHFSRFFRPGSIVLGSKVQGPGSKPNDGPTANIIAASVLNHKTGHLIVNIVNKLEDKKTVNIIIDEMGITTSNSANKAISDGTYTLDLDAKSINSLVIKL